MSELRALRPPADFRSADQVEWARFCNPPPIERRRYTGNRRLGVAYEAKAQAHFSERYGCRYLANPWMLYSTGGRQRWCQPDGLLFNPKAGAITIFEMKYQHTALAWWQVMRLYLPVLKAAFPPELWRYHFCEIVKWFDVATPFPVPVSLAAQPEALRDVFTVHIWTP